ncbi:MULTISPECIES: hypothetical protein [unclassified Stenotrophomonas]|uniref:hypothetical protein n=1 Tax=unclassified Stenotrophomonas TaxID=196198 RepID=UPI0011B20DBE|nr:MULTISPECIES: hypothetical protein [unclassified Stenotrophomonas]
MLDCFKTSRAWLGSTKDQLGVAWFRAEKQSSKLDSTGQQVSNKARCPSIAPLWSRGSPGSTSTPLYQL